MNSSTGEVFCTRPLDRESPSSASFLLSVIARDADRPRMTAEAALLVHVDDENDNAPEFEEGNELSVAEDAEVGHLVGVVKAKDADEGENGRVT